MTTPSSFQSKGFSVEVYEPPVLGDSHLFTLMNEVSIYNHVISASGGFISASFTMNVRLEDAEELF